MQDIQIGIIGGSGLYKMEDLTIIEELDIDTPFGKPSAPLVVGEINNVKVAFLARHGKNHSLLPSEVPYKANIYALKSIGVKYILSVSAVGSLREEVAPRHLLVVDQYIDNTKNRANTFFGNGILAHVSMAKPTCPLLSKIIFDEAKKIMPENSVHPKGTYIAIEGPQFSSYAESQFFRQINADVVGMTNMPEAKLAMEAQIAYSAMAMITDYDCWHPHEEAVTAEIAIANLTANAQTSQKIVKQAIQIIAKEKPISAAHSSLASGLITPLESLEGTQKEMLTTLLN